MDTGDEGLDHDEGWAAVKRLIDLARREPPPPLSAEQRSRVLEGLHARLDRERLWQSRRIRVFAIH